MLATIPTSLFNHNSITAGKNMFIWLIYIYLEFIWNLNSVELISLIYFDFVTMRYTGSGVLTNMIL